MPSKYFFGHGVLAFFPNIFCSISDEALVQWTIEHCVFAYNSYVKSNEFVTAVRREFNIHRSQSLPTHKTIIF